MNPRRYREIESPLCPFCGGVGEHDIRCPARDVGALERQNPLPASIYSVDLPNDKVPEFRRWQQGRSSVKVLKTNDDGEHSWILFSVSQPTVWASGLGFPEISKATDERPQAFEPEKDPLDKLGDKLPKPEDFAITAYMGGFIAVGLGLYLFRKEIFSNVKQRLRSSRGSRSRRD
jgi:hypothetical protein